MGFRLIERRETMYKKFRTRITGRDRVEWTAPIHGQMPFIPTSTPTAALFSPTSTKGNSTPKNFHKSFAVVSLGIAMLGFAVVPRPAGAASNNTSVKRDAAGNQFGRAEEMREALNTKPADKRSLAEYKQVVNAYRRVYLITPHAGQVPPALLAIGELNTEMGDKFGRSFYQAAVDSYQFLIREYPLSKLLEEARL